MGVASHHHMAAMTPSETSRSASGVRRDFSSILQARPRRLPGRGPSAKTSDKTSAGRTAESTVPPGRVRRCIAGVAGLYDDAIKLCVCWTKLEIPVIAMECSPRHGSPRNGGTRPFVLAVLETHFVGITDA